VLSAETTLNTVSLTPYTTTTRPLVVAMDPLDSSAHPRVLQEYWKGYKRNKQIEPTGEKDNTALIAGLLIGIIFFLFPFIVVSVRRYVFR